MNKKEKPCLFCDIRRAQGSEFCSGKHRDQYRVFKNSLGNLRTIEKKKKRTYTAKQKKAWAEIGRILSNKQI